ncbi:MAG: hypothetical protein U0401_08855 [Anaerolineae bacterium]
MADRLDANDRPRQIARPLMTVFYLNSEIVLIFSRKRWRGLAQDLGAFETYRVFLPIILKL